MARQVEVTLMGLDDRAMRQRLKRLDLDTLAAINDLGSNLPNEIVAKLITITAIANRLDYDALFSDNLPPDQRRNLRTLQTEVRALER